MGLVLKNKDTRSLVVLLNYLQEAVQKGKVTIQASGQKESLEISESVLKAFQEQINVEKTEKTVSIAEASVILSLREEVVKRLIESKKIPTVKIENELRISVEKLEKFKAKMLKDQKENFAEYVKASQTLNQAY